MTATAPPLTGTAAVLAGPRRFALAAAPVAEPEAGEVLVRVEGCGVCASSLPVWQGRRWFTYPLAPGAPGHEGWGVELESGRRVAFLSDRAFATHVAVRSDEIVPLAPELDGVPFPGEAFGCALNVFARSGVGRGETVAIVGAGFLGLALVQLCAGAGASTYAVSHRDAGRELARAFGARVSEELPEAGCDVVIEAAGRQDTLDQAARLCKTRGRLVIAGYHQDGLRTVDLQSWNWRGLDVINAHEREPAIYREGMRAAVRAVVDGLLDPVRLLTHSFPLDQLDDAFRTAEERPDGFVKAIVTMP